jgi:hypothetical protein
MFPTKFGGLREMRMWREAQKRLGFVLVITLQLLLMHFLHCPCVGYFGHRLLNKEGKRDARTDQDRLYS